MSLSSPSGTSVPDVVTALATLMDRSSAWLAATGSATGRLFYPVADPSATMPFAVLAPTSQRRATVAPGVSIPSGGQVAIHITAAADPLTLEHLAAQVLTNLMGETSGLHVVDGEAGMASVPVNRETANDSGNPVARSITITLTYGFRT